MNEYFKLFFFSKSFLFPLLGSVGICTASGVIGVFTTAKKRSLVGETLSHASYPGILLGLMYSAWNGSNDSYFLITLCGLAFAFLGLSVLKLFKSLFSFSEDSSLSATIAAFFGLSMLPLSYMVKKYPYSIRKVAMYIYGNSISMGDSYVVASVLLAVIVVVFFIFAKKEILALCFDSAFAKHAFGIRALIIELILFFLTAMAVLIGSRAVGIMLITAVLVLPAAVAMKFTQSFYRVCVLSGIIGFCSGFFGFIISLIFPIWFSLKTGQDIFIPTGATIALFASLIALFAIFLSKEGILFVLARRIKFHYKCCYENFLKEMWNLHEKTNSDVHKKDLRKELEDTTILNFYCCLKFAQLKDLCSINRSMIQLTEKGFQKGAALVRRHRLWELYLVNCLGECESKVHSSAEEMEHILDDELERKLNLLLKFPHKDPHNRIIP